MSAELMSKIAAVTEGQAMLLSTEEVAATRQALSDQAVLLEARKKVAAFDWTILLKLIPTLLPILFSLIPGIGSLVPLINAIIAALFPNVNPLPVPTPPTPPIPGGGGGPVPVP